jgi:hypothetical protein
MSILLEGSPSASAVSFLPASIADLPPNFLDLDQTVLKEIAATPDLVNQHIDYRLALHRQDALGAVANDVPFLNVLSRPYGQDLDAVMSGANVAWNLYDPGKPLDGNSPLSAGFNAADAEAALKRARLLSLTQPSLTPEENGQSDYTTRYWAMIDHVLDMSGAGGALGDASANLVQPPTNIYNAVPEFYFGAAAVFLAAARP